MRDSPGTAVDSLGTAVERAVSYLFGQQRDDGFWTDTLPSSAVATGPALIGLHYHDREARVAELETGCSWLRETQLPDGGWGDTPDTDGNLLATAFAMGALAIVDPENSEEALKKGMRFVEEKGGIEAIADRRRTPQGPIAMTFWELAGLCDAGYVPKIPIEIALARKVLRHRMSFTVPGIFALGLMQARTQPRGRVRRLVDRAAEVPALAYFRQLQRFDGYAGGFEESPLLAGVVLMALTRAGLLPEINRRSRDFLLETRRGDGSWAVDRDLELTASTAVVMGLQEAGFAGDSRLTPTLYRLLSAQRSDRCPATGAPAGGWSWALPSGWPDVDDTAAALTVLPGWRARAAAPAMVTGVDWLLNMQRRDGSWGCFVTRGSVDLDGPCPLLAAHALEGLHASGRMAADDPQIRRAFTAFARVQRPDGSFPSLWYRPYTLGTAAVLTAYGKYGLGSGVPARRAADWLLATQLPDGGWGDGTGRKSTADETAWALYGLLESGHPPVAGQRRRDHGLVASPEAHVPESRSEALARAAGWLVRHQTSEGGWIPAVVGVYFPDLYYSNDHVTNGYALRALAAYRRRIQDSR